MVVTYHVPDYEVIPFTVSIAVFSSGGIIYCRFSLSETFLLQLIDFVTSSSMLC